MVRQKQDGQISYSDVAAYLRDVTARRGGYWCFTLAADQSRDGRHRMSVVLERRDDIVLSRCTQHPKREWGYFPSNDHRTLASLLWFLCFKLDNRLDDAETLAQSEMPF